jgi:predicted RNase H-like HicB family nuclease
MTTPECYVPPLSVQPRCGRQRTRPWFAPATASLDNSGSGLDGRGSRRGQRIGPSLIGKISPRGCILGLMSDSMTLTAVFTPDEDGWTMAQLAEWPAVVTCGRTVEEAREMLLDAAREMIASYRDEGREPPIGGGHVEPLTISLAA